MKNLKFVGSSLDDLREFPLGARKAAGYQLHQVQNGQEPDDWKPLTTVGKGVREIRIHIEGQYRIIYIAKFEETIFVLHAFQKKTQKTSPLDINLAKNRYKLLQGQHP